MLQTLKSWLGTYWRPFVEPDLIHFHLVFTSWVTVFPDDPIPGAASSIPGCQFIPLTPCIPVMQGKVLLAFSRSVPLTGFIHYALPYFESRWNFHCCVPGWYGSTFQIAIITRSSVLFSLCANAGAAIRRTGPLMHTTYSREAKVHPLLSLKSE